MREWVRAVSLGRGLAKGFVALEWVGSPSPPVRVFSPVQGSKAETAVGAHA